MATGATDVISLVPGVRFAYHAPGVHGSLEASAALIGGLAAYLAIGRFRRSRLLGDLLLASGLAVLALANAFTVFAPSSPESEASTALLWLAAGVGTCGAAVFAAAALVPARLVQDGTRAERVASAVVLGVGGALVVALVGLRGVLPVAVELGVKPSSSSGPQLVGHPMMLVLQLVGLAAFTFAAVGFTRRAGRGGEDDFLCWLGVAAVLGAAAKANYTLYPSLYTDWVYSGDAFRLLFNVVILLAAARQIRRHWEEAANAAVLEERRRLARDLHDGLAQELAYVLRHARRLDPRDSVADRIARGVDRALDESRRAISALSEPLDEPLPAALARAARDAARRAGTTVRVNVDPGIDVGRLERDALVRIVAEAVTNAGRHSGAPRVTLTCTKDDHVRLRVADAGVGFDTSVPVPAGRFGVNSMSERAALVGADFRIASARGTGTVVEVTL